MIFITCDYYKVNLRKQTTDLALKRSKIDLLELSDLAIIGLPWDEYSSYLKGPSKAPPLIIEALESNSANYFTEDLIDLDDHPRIKWLGNAGINEYFNISTYIDLIIAKGAVPVSLGGDHSVTYPILKSLAQQHEMLNILHFDAHGDLYDELDGNRYSHACPFARIMEEGLAKRLVQVGIRTLTKHQKEQADRFGVEMIQMKDFDQDRYYEFDGPVYISFDLDVLDPAYAPGTSHHEPGGLTTRQAITVIQKLDLEIIGMDLVEYNPDRDVNGMTAMVAAKIFKELISKVLN